MWDKLEAVALAAAFLYAWRSPVRHAAISTAFALAVFHILSRYYIGHYGAGIEGAVAVSIVASIIALAHLAFNYGIPGLITGVAFALIPAYVGFAWLGHLEIVQGQGPGFDMWTLISLSAWVSWGVLFVTIWKANKNAVG